MSATSGNTSTDAIEQIKALVEAQKQMLLELVDKQGQGSRAELERLAALIGEQVRSRSGELSETEQRLADRYARLRQQLAGPDEGLALPVPRIAAIVPETAAPGETVVIRLAHAGDVEGVAFTGPGGTPVPAVATSVQGQSVSAKVPSGAETGPVTVRTSRGDAVSDSDFRIGVVQAPATYDLVLWGWAR